MCLLKLYFISDMDSNMDTNMDKINIEKLITEVLARPAIWDLRHKDYADKIKKNRSWEEIMDIFVENEDETTKNKKDISKFLLNIVK